MFNKTIINKSEREYVPFEKTVTEIKAPTDKSIELLNEMQEKARKNIIDTVSLRNNNFDATFLVSDSPHDYQKVITYKYKINHVEYFGEIKADFNFQLTRRKALDFVLEKINSSLYREIINPLAQAIFNSELLDKRY